MARRPLVGSSANFAAQALERQRQNRLRTRGNFISSIEKRIAGEAIPDETKIELTERLREFKRDVALGNASIGGSEFSSGIQNIRNLLSDAENLTSPRARRRGFIQQQRNLLADQPGIRQLFSGIG